jgi:hypothetical protein
LPSFECLESSGIIPLPNLRSFRGYNDTDRATFYRICGPRVTSIYLEFDPRPYLVPHDCLKLPPDRILTLPPSLRDLKFTTADGEILIPIYRAVTLLPSLEVLRCATGERRIPGRHVPKDVLDVLLSSDDIRELDYAQSRNFLDSLSQAPAFRLEHLGLETDDFQECTEVLKRIDTSRLNSLCILYHGKDPVGYPTYPLAWKMERFFLSLQSCCDLSVLASIAYEGPSDNCPQEGEYHITIETVEPLLRFPCLEKLVLMSGSGFTFDNDSIKTFVSAWPKMRHLNINPWSTLDNRVLYENSSHYSITLDGLIPIAQSWPELTDLKLCFRPQMYRSPGNSIADLLRQDIIPQQLRHSKLKTLGVGDSLMTAPQHVVAAFLHELFPDLEETVPWSDFTNPAADSWWEIGRIIKYLKKLEGGRNMQ